MALASGEAAARQFKGNVEPQKPQVSSLAIELTASRQEKWQKIMQNFVDEIDKILHSDALADPFGFDDKLNTAFASFFNQSAEFRGHLGVQNAVTDMLALHYVLLQAPALKVKEDSVTMHILNQAWDMVTEQAVKDSIASGARSSFTFVPPDVA